MKDSGVSRLIKSAYDLLGLQTYLTTGEKGKLRIEGKEYVMKDGDVVEWRFNV